MSAMAGRQWRRKVTWWRSIKGVASIQA